MDENNQNQMDPMQPMEPMNPTQPVQDNTQGQYQQYQQYQAPQQNYQQPQYQQTQPQGGNGFGVAALVLGIIALLLCWIPYVNITCTLLAFIFGIIGIVKSSGKGQAIAGLVLSIIAAIPTVIIMVFLNAIFGALGWFGAHIENATNTWWTSTNTNSSTVWNSLGSAWNTIENGLQQAGNELGNIGNEIENRLTNATTNTTTTTTSSVDSKVSTVASPAKIGEWTTSSAYNDSKYIDAPFRVNKVSRGADAEALIKASGKTMSSKLLEGNEWIVIDYSVDTTDFKPYSSGARSLIGMSLAIRGTDGETLKYDGKTYMLTGSDLLSTSLFKEKIYNGQYVFQLPKGCTDYLIQAKASQGSVAYVKGE